MARGARHGGRRDDCITYERLECGINEDAIAAVMTTSISTSPLHSGVSGCDKNVRATGPRRRNVIPSGQQPTERRGELGRASELRDGGGRKRRIFLGSGGSLSHVSKTALRLSDSQQAR